MRWYVFMGHWNQLQKIESNISTVQSLIRFIDDEIYLLIFY